jgi:hypothetical protein
MVTAPPTTIPAVSGTSIRTSSSWFADYDTVDVALFYEFLGPIDQVAAISICSVKA